MREIANGKSEQRENISRSNTYLSESTDFKTKSLLNRANMSSSEGEDDYTQNESEVTGQTVFEASNTTSSAYTTAETTFGQDLTIPPPTSGLTTAAIRQQAATDHYVAMRAEQERIAQNMESLRQMERKTGINNNDNARKQFTKEEILEIHGWHQQQSTPEEEEDYKARLESKIRTGI